MPPTVSLTSSYRYFALYCFVVMAICVAGMIVYEYYFGPIPKGAQHGLWFAQTMSPTAATAGRFVQHHRRGPTDDEKKKLARVSLALAVGINALPFIAVTGWIFVTAFVVGDPRHQLTYYIYRQKTVSLLASADAIFWMIVLCVPAVFLTVSYILIRWQYGRSAQRMAARLSPQW